MEMSEDAKDRKPHPRKDRGEHGCHVASHSVILENVSKPTRQWILDVSSCQHYGVFYDIWRCSPENLCIRNV